jgi:hypothetical protein
LVADDKHHVGLATDSHPVLPLHLFQDGFLKGRSCVRKALSAHAEEYGVPIEDDAVGLVEPVIMK